MDDSLPPPVPRRAAAASPDATDSAGETDAAEAPPASPVRIWIRRFGVAGFLFFLVKGLLWLSLPTLLVVFGVRC